MAVEERCWTADVTYGLSDSIRGQIGSRVWAFGGQVSQGRELGEVEEEGHVGWEEERLRKSKTLQVQDGVE